ncbi:TspO/MBR family protein [soil metagenome]
MKPFNLFTLIICLAIPLIIGGISGYATMDGLTSWYQTLNKPSFNPPNYLFGPVWTTLYVFMGISLYLIWRAPLTDVRKLALIIFSVQLILNFFWSIIFFSYHSPGLALIEIAAMWISICIMIYVFQKVNKTAAYLQIPYLLWVSFASILNAAIWKLN